MLDQKILPTKVQDPGRQRFKKDRFADSVSSFFREIRNAQRRLRWTGGCSFICCWSGTPTEAIRRITTKKVTPWWNKEMKDAIQAKKVT